MPRVGFYTIGSATDVIRVSDLVARSRFCKKLYRIPPKGRDQWVLSFRGLQQFVETSRVATGFGSNPGILQGLHQYQSQRLPASTPY